MQLSNSVHSAKINPDGISIRCGKKLTKLKIKFLTKIGLIVQSTKYFQRTSSSSPVGQMVMRLSLEQQARSSNFRSVKSGHSEAIGSNRWNISLKGTLLTACTITRRWTPKTRYTLWRVKRVQKDLYNWWNKNKISSLKISVGGSDCYPTS